MKMNTRNSILLAGLLICSLTVLPVAGQGGKPAPAKPVSPPPPPVPKTDQNAADIAAKMQEDLDRQIKGLDAELDKIGPCRAGEIQALFERLGEKRRQVREQWNTAYADLLQWAKGKRSDDDDAIKKVPYLVDSLAKDIENREKELSAASRR